MLIKVNKRGQITIPKAMREQLGIKPGDQISLVELEQGLLLSPATVSIFDLKGSIPVQPDGPYTIRQLKEQVGAHLSKRSQYKK